MLLAVCGWDIQQRATALYLATPCHFDSFLIGSLLALQSKRPAGLERWSKPLWGAESLAPLQRVIAFVAIMAFTLGLAGISFEYFESPLARYLRARLHEARGIAIRKAADASALAQ